MADFVFSAKFTSKGVAAYRKQIVYSISGGLNDAGRKIFTQVRRQLREQTGAKKYSTITSRTWVRSSTPVTLTYAICANSYPTDIAEFGVKVMGKGVWAAPWGKGRVLARTFQNVKWAGFGNSGGYFQRVGDGRFPIRALHGPNLGKELMGLTPRSHVPELVMTSARVLVAPAIAARISRIRV